MVTIDEVRSSNANLKTLGSGLVGVFVGATAGIGETTAREFVRNTTSPKVYIVGRNETQGNNIVSEFQALNSDAAVKFIKSDVSLIKNVDEACETIKAAETKINLLFLSQGMMTTAGRNETVEGLDTKFSLHYYSRMRFITNLLPLLQSASSDDSTPPHSRVISVLAAGLEARLNTSDLSLKHNFSVKTCADHATTMNSLAVRTLAQKYPGISFIHDSPGAVQTDLLRNLHPWMGVAAKWMMKTPFIPGKVSLKECGEKHVYAATNDAFKPRSEGHLLWWDLKQTGNEKLLKEYEEQGVRNKVFEHTEEVFRQIKEKGRYEP